MANLIPEDEQKNVMDNFWMMLRECESRAESNNDVLLKNWVEQWYNIWNRLNIGDSKPRWLRK